MISDVVTETYSPIFQAKNVSIATRMFFETFQSDSNANLSPSDYRLYYCGELNLSNGELDVGTVPYFICLGTDAPIQPQTIDTVEEEET
jgi:hypothetical protein